MVRRKVLIPQSVEDAILAEAERAQVTPAEIARRWLEAGAETPEDAQSLADKIRQLLDEHADQ